MNCSDFVTTGPASPDARMNTGKSLQEFGRNIVCDVCWNNDKGLCLNCAPDVQSEVEAARVQGEISGAVELAAEEGAKKGKARDVKAVHRLTCPRCGEETRGAKFCPACGFKLAQQNACPACSAKVSPSAKFCPECGGKMAG